MVGNGGWALFAELAGGPPDRVRIESADATSSAGRRPSVATWGYRHASFGSQSVEQSFNSDRDEPLPDLGVRTGVDVEEAVPGVFRPGFEVAKGTDEFIGALCLLHGDVSFAIVDDRSSVRMCRRSVVGCVLIRINLSPAVRSCTEREIELVSVRVDEGGGGVHGGVSSAGGAGGGYRGERMIEFRGSGCTRRSA